MLKEIEKSFFWVFLTLGITLGMLFPSAFASLEGFVIYVVMIIMGLLYLKVDIVDILTHIKRPFFILYIALFNLIAIPLICYFGFFQFLDPKMIAGLVLLSTLPAGVSSAAFTDIMEGRTSLNLTLIIVTNLLSTVTIPFVFILLSKTNPEFAQLNLGYSHALNLFINLLKIIFIPFFIAKILKHVILRDIIPKFKDYYNLIIVVLLSIMIMVSIATQAEFIIQNFTHILKSIAILFPAFIIFQLLGYFSIFWHKKGEKLAVSNSKMIMNNILGVVLALAFFTPEVASLLILSLIPWTIMIIAKHWYKKFLP